MNILKLLSRTPHLPTHSTALLKGLVPVLLFSSSVNNKLTKGSKDGIEDWQYCKLISEQLKNQNIN